MSSGMSQSARRAVVTGGAGLVGSFLCERLLDDGYAVVAVDNLLTGSVENLETAMEHARFEFLERDVTEPFDVTGRVDLVFHLASPAAPVHYGAFPLETLRAGSRGTEEALALAERKSARFLLASTSEVYGDPLVHPQPETYWGNVNPIGPRSVYDEAKRFAEALVSAYRRTGRVDTAIVRIFNTYGPRMSEGDGRAVPAFVDQAIGGVPMTVAGDGRQTRSLCYVTDTAEALQLVAESRFAGPMNVGGDGEMTMLALAELIRDLAGSTSSVSLVERPVDDPAVRRPDLTLIRRSLGWRAKVDLHDGLARTIAWRRQRQLSSRKASA